MTPNIAKMSLKELTDLHQRVSAEIPKAKSREVAKVKQEIVELAAKHGMALSEIVGTGTGKRRQRKPSTAMRDLNGVIWAGRGRMPKGFDKDKAQPIAA